MKFKRNTRIIGVFVCLMIIIGINYLLYKKETKISSDIDNSHYTYDTNQYQVFKQLSNLISICEPEQIEYQKDIVINNAIYHQYILNQINVNVFSMENNIDTTTGIYYIINNNNTITFNEDIPQYPEAISIYYVDINNDQKKDLVIKGEPYSGTNNTYYWIHAFDLTTLDEIPIFSSKNRYLTITQEEQLKSLLIKDTKFKEVFSDLERMDYSSEPLIDKLGNVYYKLGLGKGINEDIGEILVLFNYNKNTKNYDVVDYVYMPKTVLLEQ